MKTYSLEEVTDPSTLANEERLNESFSNKNSDWSCQAMQLKARKAKHMTQEQLGELVGVQKIPNCKN